MDIKPNEWINAKSIHIPPKKNLKPPVDKAVSMIVGKNVLAQDPRLLGLIMKWKAKNQAIRAKLSESEAVKLNDNLMENPEFIKELKETFQC